MHDSANEYDGTLTLRRYRDWACAAFILIAILLGAGARAAVSVVTETAGYVTTSSAQVGGSVTATGQTASVWFEFGATTNYGSATAPVTVPATNTPTPVSSLIAGLAAETLHHFRAVASNSGGVVYGDNQTFTTRAVTELNPGHGLSFNGVNGFVTTSLLVTNPQTFTLSLWFKASASPGGKLIGLGNSPNANSSLHDRAIYLATNGTVFAGVYDGTAVRTAVGTNALNNGLWHHVAFTFSPTNGLRLYVDGSLAATNFIPTNAQAYNGYWRLGWDSGWLPNPQPYLNARVDEVQVWNVARSAAEIAGSMTTPLSGNEPGLVEYWRFSEGAGPTTADGAAAQGGNTATLVGGVTWQLPAPPRPFALLPLITALPATDILTNSATLNGTVNPNGSAAAAWFEYGLTTNYTGFTPATLLGSTNLALAVSDAIGGLSRGTTYHFRLVATNASGLSYSADQTFDTLTLPPAVTGLVVTGLTNTTATLNGSVLPNDTPTAVWFEWGTASFAPDQQTSPLLLGAGTNLVPVSQTITSLTPALIYYGQLVASNAAGISRGATARFGSPAITFNDPATNECHVAYVETAAASNAPFELSSGSGYNLALRADRRVVVWGDTTYVGTNVPAGATNIVAVSAGAGAGFAVRADGRVFAWGASGFSPTNVPGTLTDAVGVASGEFHGVAVRANGSLVAWGSNQLGQITIPASATNVTAVAAKMLHNLALRSDGTVVPWGQSDFGLNTVPPEATNVAAAACGNSFNLVLRADGNLVSWGNGPAVPPEATNVAAIAAGRGFALALRRDGSVIAWGDNAFGQCNVPASATNIVAITAGMFHSLATRADGTVIGWGNSNYGATVLPVTATTLPFTAGPTPNVNVPGSYVMSLSASNALGGRAVATRTIQVADTLPPVITLNGGSPVTNGLNTPYFDNGATSSDLCSGFQGVTVLGSVNVSNAGDYTLTYISTDPAGNTGTNTRLVRVQAMRPDAFTILSNRTIGSNDTAELRSVVTPNGLATVAWFEWGTSTNPFPNRTAAVPLGDRGRFLELNIVVTGIVPGRTYFYRVAASNALGVAYGVAEDFKVPVMALNGSASVTNECHSPFADPGAASLDALRQMVCGWNHVMVLYYDGTVRAWGAGTNLAGFAPHYGQSIVPAGLSNIVAIDAGKWHSLAVRSNGTVTGWGYNLSGQVNIPAAATNVIAVSGGDEHSLALRANGTVIGWGAIGSGQTTIPASATNITAISAGAFHSLALRADGTVLGWGANGSGEINIPAAATNVMAIGAGDSYSLVLRSNGTVIAWGNNGLGQINVPFAASNVTAIAVGRGFNLALRADGAVIGWGYNGQGQLNFNPTLSNFVMIAAGDGHSHALMDYGYIYNVGNTGYGENTPPSNLLGGSRVRVEGTLNTDVPGTYTLNYMASNSLQGFAQVTRTVVVRDTLPPQVTLNGPALVILTNATPPWIDPGATAVDLCAGAFSAVGQSNINFNVPGSYTANYVATDPSGNSVTNTRQVVVAYSTFTPPTVPGDTNGDGIISQAELAGVLANLNGTGAVTPGDLSLILSNYWPTSPWLLMTNVAGLGTPNVTFALPGAVEAPFRVEATTNLIDWENLGPLTPRYEFLDTNAPVVPNRSYRLRWP